MIGDHTSMLRLSEARFIGARALSARDASASDLAEMFDFATAPSMNTALPAPIPTPGVIADHARLPNPHTIRQPRLDDGWAVGDGNTEKRVLASTGQL